MHTPWTANKKNMGNQALKTTIYDAAKNGNVALLTESVQSIGTNLVQILSDGFPDGITPLHKASQNGFLDAVKYLVEHQADSNKLDDYYRSPLYYAASLNQVDVVDYLVNYRKVKLRIKYRQKDANTGEVKTTEKESPLHCAAAKGHFQVCQILIAAGAYVNLSINDATLLFDETPLHRAAQHGHLEVMKLLVHNGAALNKGDADGNTALHKACYCNHLKCVEFLISEGSSIDPQNGKHEIPLDMARKGGHRDIERIYGTSLLTSSINIVLSIITNPITDV